MCKIKCTYGEVNGIRFRIAGTDKELSPKTLAAIKKMVTLVHAKAVNDKGNSGIIRGQKRT